MPHLIISEKIITLFKKILLFFLLVFSVKSYAQQYNGAYIIKKADSIIIQTVGQDIFDNHYSFDVFTYYTYKTNSGKIKYETLKPGNKTKGIFLGVNVRYSFCLGIYNCCVWNNVSLNNSLLLTKSIDTSFIPRYILNRQPPNFLNDSIAISIAKKVFTKKGIEPISLSLSYDNNKNRYILTLNNILTKIKDVMGRDAGKMELLELDAFTGAQISYYPDAIYGSTY